MCYCKNSGGDLDASIAAAEAKGPQVTSAIEAAEGKLAQTKADLKQAQVDRSAAKTAIEEATAIREKEAAAFAAYKADADVNVAAIVKATAAVEKGMGGAFLQTTAASALLSVVKKESFDFDTSDLVSFLSQEQGDAKTINTQPMIKQTS